MGSLNRRFGVPALKRAPPLLNALHFAEQVNRLTNLKACVDQLRREGATSRQKQAELLGLSSGRDLASLLTGIHIYDDAAREIEWSMNKPKGWLDRDHRLEPLDD